jgi:drug/metabolite transporter (DMT)-like permease
LLAAAIPAVVSSVMEGVPGALRLAGFALAGGAIWLIAAGESPESAGESSGTMALAIFAGVAFGIYFVALKMASPLGVVMPMAIARSSSITLCLLVLGGLGLWGRRSELQVTAQKSRWFGKALLWAAAVALLDTGGNLLFLAAARLGRLDVASVLASLYPAGTILLAAWALHERPTRRQVVGMGVALAAVVMITV